MGNICGKESNPQIQSKNQQFNPNQIRSTIHDQESDKINEIREFLSLTSKNTTQILKLPQNKANLNVKNKRKQKNISDFKVMRGLGKGAFGQVFMVKDMQQNKYYAMKIINKNNITNTQQKINTLAQRFILEAVDHPFIVKLHYAFQSQKKLYLLCDLMTGGELFYLLRRNKKFQQEVAKFYAAEILLALQYLHSRNIIYRDLKPENILLDQTGHIKITDFGLSKVCNSDKQLTYSICGTPEYIAPQVMKGKGYSQTADWFSFGSLLFDMLTGKPPFYSSNKDDILRKITSKSVPIPSDLSPEAQSLLKNLFQIKPKERLGFVNDAEQIKNHSFFKNIDFQKLYLLQLQPPISFQQALNQEGFDMDFHNQSYESTMNIDRTIKEKGVVFDGFTYYKPQIISKKQQGLRRLYTAEQSDYTS